MTTKSQVAYLAQNNLRFFKKLGTLKKDEVKFNRLSNIRVQEYLHAYFDLKYTQNYESILIELQDLAEEMKKDESKKSTYDQLLQDFQRRCAKIEAMAYWTLEKSTEELKHQQNLYKYLIMTSLGLGLGSALTYAFPELITFILALTVGLLPAVIVMICFFIYLLSLLGKANAGTVSSAAAANPGQPTGLDILIEFSIYIGVKTYALLLPVMPYIAIAAGITALGLFIAAACVGWKKEEKAVIKILEANIGREEAQGFSFNMN